MAEMTQAGYTAGQLLVAFGGGVALGITLCKWLAGPAGRPRRAGRRSPIPALNLSGFLGAADGALGRPALLAGAPPPCVTPSAAARASARRTLAPACANPRWGLSAATAGRSFTSEPSPYASGLTTPSETPRTGSSVSRHATYDVAAAHDRHGSCPNTA